MPDYLNLMCWTIIYAMLKIKIIEYMDLYHDNLKFYRLDNQYRTKVERIIGIKASLDLEGLLIL